MEFLASWPNWAIYALVGGIIGALLAGLGWFVENKIGWRPGRFLPVLALAMTIPISERMVLPALESARMCNMAQGAIANTPVNQAIDDFTTFSEMHVDCGNRSIVYDMRINFASTIVTSEGDWAAVRNDLNAVQCGHAVWRGYIAKGWRISNEYIFTDGLRRKIDAAC